MSIEKFKLQGKYQVTLEDGYKMTINRNNEPWMTTEELSGNNIMLAMIQKIPDLSEVLKDVGCDYSCQCGHKSCRIERTKKEINEALVGMEEV